MFPFVKDALITDLGFGAGFALWGFRGIAGGQGNCCRLNVGFNKAFAMESVEYRTPRSRGNSRLALNALKSFAYQLGNTGKRKVILSSSGTMQFTADELCIVSVLAAAQQRDQNLCHAHLLWLLGTAETHYAYQAAATYGLVCSDAGITLEMPHKDISDQVPTLDDIEYPQNTVAYSSSRNQKG